MDHYPEMLPQIPEDAPIAPFADDALAFSKRQLDYDKILIKETIHHVNRKKKFFANLYRNLPLDGIVLLAHVSPDVKYSLFNAALERRLGWHADPNTLAEVLKQTEFEVEQDALDSQHVIPQAHDFKMVKSCYMSVLTSFSEEELDASLAERNAKYAGKPMLRFTDHDGVSHPNGSPSIPDEWQFRTSASYFKQYAQHSRDQEVNDHRPCRSTNDMAFLPENSRDRACSNHVVEAGHIAGGRADSLEGKNPCGFITKSVAICGCSSAKCMLRKVALPEMNEPSAPTPGQCPHRNAA